VKGPDWGSGREREGREEGGRERKSKKGEE
jgi:hypothetical protein